MKFIVTILHFSNQPLAIQKQTFRKKKDGFEAHILEKNRTKDNFQVRFRF